MALVLDVVSSQLVLYVITEPPPVPVPDPVLVLSADAPQIVGDVLSPELVLTVRRTLPEDEVVTGGWPCSRLVTNVPTRSAPPPGPRP